MWFFDFHFSFLKVESQQNYLVAFLILIQGLNVNSDLLRRDFAHDERRLILEQRQQIFR